jgi:hypothetical protein
MRNAECGMRDKAKLRDEAENAMQDAGCRIQDA